MPYTSDQRPPEPSVLASVAGEPEDFWFGASAAPSPRERDITGICAVVILIGVGLTSVILALLPWRDSHEGARQRQQIEALTEGLQPPPQEVLLAAPELEAVLIAGASTLRGIPMMLLARDDRPRLSSASAWVIHPEGEPLRWPYEQREASSSETREGLRAEVFPSSKSVWLRDLLPGAQARYVPIKGDGPVFVCDRWWLDRRECGAESWLWIGVKTLSVNKNKEPCIWAHPKDGHALHVVFKDLTLRSPLFARAALSDFAVESRDGGSVDIRVLVDDREVVSLAHTNRKGWRTLRIPEQDHPVTLTWIISAKNTGRRHFCFDGEVKTP